MTNIRDLITRMDVDQKIGQVQGVVPMDLVDFVKVFDPSAPRPDLSKGFPYDIDRLAEVRPHGVGHLSLGWQLDQDLDGLRRALARFQDVAPRAEPIWDRHARSC